MKTQFDEISEKNELGNFAETLKKTKSSDGQISLHFNEGVKAHSEQGDPPNEPLLEEHCHMKAQFDEISGQQESRNCTETTENSKSTDGPISEYLKETRLPVHSNEELRSIEHLTEIHLKAQFDEISQPQELGTWTGPSEKVDNVEPISGSFLYRYTITKQNDTPQNDTAQNDTPQNEKNTNQDDFYKQPEYNNQSTTNNDVENKPSKSSGMVVEPLLQNSGKSFQKESCHLQQYVSSHEEV